MFKAIRVVRIAVADTQENKRSVAYVHCHADQIKLGVKGRRLMSVASPNQDTCIDMNDITRGCRNNLLVNTTLASGYHHGRGNVKPPTTGILKLLGNKTFDSIFHIKVRKHVSLAFAVDITGSMSQEIAAVKERIIQLVTTIELSLNDSTVIAFTDADAKDAYRIDELTKAALAKNIKITILKTGQCNRRKRRSSKRSVSTSEVILETLKWTANEQHERAVFVDKTVQVLKISIKGGQDWKMLISAILMVKL
ncbi:unnamed protein product [Mytilus edulis]|uniref:Hemicentin-1-like von Willebrand factor A domain-containing protein n=1 Tax=Mytilus edulis TaxID=6550 RepID=A0A8S3UAC2_MYTED|nr:unnamed protein product [Mytilus edulis]